MAKRCCACASSSRSADTFEIKEMPVSDASLTPAELDLRIADVEENLRVLVEQAAAFSGSSDEDRSSDRIAEQQAELDELKRQRDQVG